MKAWQLKYWAFLTGVQTTGTKAELQALLTSRLNETPRLERPTKIVSVDMGIRNLAYCAIEAPALELHAGDTALRKALRVTAWKRMDLTQSSPSRDYEWDRAFPLENDNKETNAAPEPDNPPIPSNAVFHPASLSHTALNLTKELLSHDPTIILLERQRFRSSGAPSIQEWTVRVNMLESMLWACLRTLKSTSNDSFPDVQAVSPAQVANFWSLPSLSALSQLDQEKDAIVDAMSTKTKLEKKGKVELVRKWCRTLEVDGEMPLKFVEAAQSAAGALADEKLRRKKLGDVGEAGFDGKLDDVADCLLQAVTWLRWERNRCLISTMAF